ncbi:hypothetical protein B296_00005674 [Ensete ventricosum]|uniref:Uncharacterized protein n=1 Tax=Ensete ventricosum TaxID=4639 RepID=A0A426Z9Z3_ENSVE|nr:hypothetical protein B296_00005674 [Ensete ventricosum]
MVEAWRCQPVPRYHGGRLQRMVMHRGSDGTNDDEKDDHKAWRYVDTHIDPIVSDWTL